MAREVLAGLTADEDAIVAPKRRGRRSKSEADGFPRYPDRVRFIHAWICAKNRDHGYLPSDTEPADAICATCGKQLVRHYWAVKIGPPLPDPIEPDEPATKTKPRKASKAAKPLKATKPAKRAAEVNLKTATRAELEAILAAPADTENEKRIKRLARSRLWHIKNKS